MDTCIAPVSLLTFIRPWHVSSHSDQHTVSIVLQKNMSAYFHFMGDVRPKIKADNPEASTGELGKLMGAAWNKIKETPAADKYKEKAAADKKRYEEEMKKYKGEYDELYRTLLDALNHSLNGTVKQDG